jgi:hypothetical protein
VSRRPSSKVCMAPMAVASDGSLLISVAEFQADTSIATLVRVAAATGLPIFVGVVVPHRFRARLAKDIDDAAADIAGRIGGTLTSGRASPSGPSSAAQAPGRPDRGVRLAPHPRGRRP